MRSVRSIFALVVSAGWLCAMVIGSAYAQNAQQGQAAASPQTTGAPPIVESYTFQTPHDVFQVRVTSTNGAMLVSTLDCCIPGDKWVVRVYCLQNNSVTDVRGKGSGSTSGYTGSVYVYRNGSQNIDCLAEIRYGQGVAVFPAGMSVRFAGGSSSETISTTRLTTLKPLPSQ